MAKGSQTFSVSLSLLTKNFQKGVKTIQTSLNNLKMQFRNFAGALGMGLGIGEIARTMIDSAKSLDKAQTVLKNVSESTEAYGKNQKFVMDISKKYNQEMTTLMGNYAKFHSAANMAGMSLEQQQYIYESLTRAATYYNLTADETNGVMLAVNQMISKGKVSSEELRRQLGERLPGAMNFAAKAMGVTTAELDKMIRDGKVMATELLPLLAEELNRVTHNLDVDTIQGALAKLRNAFTDLVSKMNVGDIYKKTINGLGKALEYIANNLNAVKQSVVSVFAGLVGGNLVNKAKANFQQYVTAIGIELRRAENMSKNFKVALDRLTEQGLIKLDVDDKGLITKVHNIGGIAQKDMSKAKNFAKRYNDELSKTIELQGKSTTAWGWMGNSIKKVGVALKSLMSSFAPMLIITAITTIIQKIGDWYKEQKRIRDIVKDTREEYDEMVNKLGGNDVELQSLQEKISKAGTDEERLKFINRINEMLGLQDKKAFTLLSTNEEINAAIQERLELLKKEREYQAARQVAAEKQSQADKKRAELANKQKELAVFNEDIKNPNSKYIDPYTYELTNEGVGKKQGLENDIANLKEEIKNLGLAVDSFDDVIAELGVDATKRQSTINNEGYNPDGDGGGNDRDLQKEYEEIQSEYNTSLRTLNEMKNNQLISDVDYQSELEKLTLKTAEQILALNDIDETTDKFARSIVQAAQGYINSQKVEDKVQVALDDYYKSVQELYNQYNNGVITQEELDEELYNLLEQVVMTIAAMGDLSGAAENLAAQLRKSRTDRSNKSASEIKDPQLGERDGTFDYRKTQSEIYGEYEDIYSTYAEQLENTIKELNGLEPTDDIVRRLGELQGELETATANAKSFGEAMKLAEVSEDVADLKKEISEGIWNNFTNIADAADRVTSAVENCIETFEDVDASGWEKVLAIFNAITQITDTLLSAVKMITTLQEAMDKLKVAEQAYQAMQDANAAKDLANAAATVAASQAEATGSGTAEAAKMPFPYNLLAIAAVVGTVAAVFASLPKFASGGIVQGNSTMGDHNLARVNAGEMILNKQQQATLFNLLNGSNSGVLGKSPNVEFKIKGSELVGVLKNHNQRIKG